MRFAIPFAGSVPILVGMGLLLIGFVMLLMFLRRRIRRLLRRLRGEPVSHSSAVAGTLRLMFILLTIAGALSLSLLGAFLQSYTAFSARERVAVVHCAPISDTIMTLELVTFHTDGSGHARRFSLQGQQWALEGYILKWDDWLNFFGLRTMYKLTRVRGRYVRSTDESTQPATVHSLVKDEEDPAWRWLFEYGRRLPVVHAVYGNTVFTFPSSAKTFQIYVTSSGFMLEEQNLQ